jgi:hypothetical protein
MLKVRIIAIIITLALTALTIYLVPIVVYHYTSFVDSLSGQQRTWFSVLQAFIGFAIAAYGFWRWKKKSASKK